jgi:hypothetical protein
MGKHKITDAQIAMVVREIERRTRPCDQAEAGRNGEHTV